MTNLEVISEAFQGLLAQACLSALLAIVGVAAAAKVLKKIRVAFSSLWRKSRFSFAAVMLLSLTMFLWADKTNLLRMIIHPGGPPVVVSAEDILRGFRLEGIVTNDEPLCDMPVDAVEYPPWRLRAGRHTEFTLDLGDFVFPYGTNFINRFRVLPGGTIETFPAQGARVSICAARDLASLSPGVSRFWSADANGGAEKVLRWDSVFANDDRTGGYSAEIRLSANGDFSTRSNEVESVFRRVSPHDWDGDGLANEIDANPYESDGDFFGTGVDWLNVNCAGVLSAATNGMGEVEISWHTNANPNAYYWLDLTATGALGVAKITATCDGESNLGDLAVIARTNEVCRVPLLVGATYTVESDLPISYSAVSSEHASIFTNSEHSLVVSFPLEFSFEPIRAAASFRLVSNPVDVNATLLSVVGGCCSCQTNDVGFTWSCDGSCPCGGGVGHMLSSTATWQGYSSLFTGWHVCPCPPVVIPEGGQGDSSPKLILDSPRTFFTNSNGGAEDSDVVRVSAGLWTPVDTNGTATLRLRQGNFVNVWSTSNRHQRVSLPLTWDVAEMRQRTVYIEGAHETARGGEALELEWRDENGGLLLATNLDIAVYHPILDVVNSSASVDDRLCNPSGIVTGTNACFLIGYREVPIPEDEIVWSIVDGTASFVGSNTGLCVKVASDVPDQRVKLRAQIDDCRSRPPEISACVVNPQYVKLTVWIVRDNTGTHSPIDVANVSNMVANANKVYEQIGVSFYIDTITYTNSDEFLDISNQDGSQNLAKRRELVNLTKNSLGLEVYFIDRIGENKKANNDDYGIVISMNWTDYTLAHEIGHSFGCVDIYPTYKDNVHVGLEDNIVRKEHAPLDWNNGVGSRYYSPYLTQMNLIGRLLMCGYDAGLRRDISSGPIYGFNETNQCGMIDVGFFLNGIRRDLYFHK